MAASSSGKEEKVLSSGDEEDQLQQRPRLLLEATLTGEEFVRQMEILKLAPSDVSGPIVTDAREGGATLPTADPC